MVTKLPYILVDDDTGQEIIAFMRRGRIYFFLRDWKTKRFIRRLRKICIKGTATVDYKSRERPYYHNIYVDVIALLDIPDRKADKLDDYEDFIANSIYDRIVEMFGAPLASYLERVKYSYHSEKTVCSLDYMVMDVIWSHYDSRGRLKTPKEERIEEVVVL